MTPRSRVVLVIDAPDVHNRGCSAWSERYKGMFAASTSYAPTAAGRRAQPAGTRARRATHARTPIRAAIAEPTSTSKVTAVGDQQTAIVVGGGVGGLGIASRLANAGYSVTILEKNSDVGGRCRSESFDGKGEGRAPPLGKTCTEKVGWHVARYERLRFRPCADSRPSLESSRMHSSCVL
jgi:hypothetical protein